MKKYSLHNYKNKGFDILESLFFSILSITNAYFLLRMIKDVIKMDENIKKKYYIVSNLKSGKLTIIDGLCNSILKEIDVGERPYKLEISDSNTIAVACDIANTISFVNCISGEIKRKHIPNNGNIQIDRINKKIFVSNTFEVNIYDINLDELLGDISGLSAIIDLKLNKDGSKLYVLDTLLKELRIYSTDSYKLIFSCKILGGNPNYFLISEDDKTAYISVGNNILKIDIYSNDIIDIILPKGSLVAGMILKDSTLYASNRGLNRIELINVVNNKAYDFILTSKPEPTRLFITEDNTKILVTNRNHGNHGTMDIIDFKSNEIISSIIMSKINSQPYDVISLSLPYTYVSPVAITNLQNGKPGVTIIANKIFAFYNENILFPIINVNLPKDTDLSLDINCYYVFKNIIFKQGIIVDNSELRSRLSTKPGFSSIKCVARVSYIINFVQNNKNNSIDGFFENPMEIFLEAPKDRELNGFDLNLKTTTKLIGTPKILDNVICFGVTARIELKVIGEDEIFFTNNEEAYYDVEEYYEAFSGSIDRIFPGDAAFPF
jgi:DNA-binding beta-propeller fold protein YncE